MTQTRIAIAGALGRMGKSLLAAANTMPTLTVTAAAVSPISTYLGQDYGMAMGLSSNGVILRAELEPTFDVLIDFSTPAATHAYVDFCVQHHKPVVIGTTGLTDETHQYLKVASQHIPIFWSPNMSIGIYVLGKLLEQATQLLTAVPNLPIDIDIHEVHHRGKKDAPSGTALQLGAIVASGLGTTLKEARFDALQDDRRKEHAIGLSVIRSGNAIGEHTVLFNLPHEQITLSHLVTDRQIFAAGALQVALWLQNQPPAYYSMQDFMAG